MCRHVAYVGPPVPLRSPLFDAPHSLRSQSHSACLMHHGSENPHGWGVAWYDAEPGSPHRYRTATAMWDDDGFAARDTAASAFLGAVRLASPGTSLHERNNAPFLSGTIAFSLNGFGFARYGELRRALSPERRARLEGDTDAEVLFAHVLDRLEAGATPGEALTGVTAASCPDGATRLNLLLTDGVSVAATAWGNSLFVLDAEEAVHVASEPLDLDRRWGRVPDRSLVQGAPGHVTVTGL